MGVRRTTEQRDYLKSINTSAAYAKRVNLMDPLEVELEFNKVKAAQLSRRSTKK